MRDRTLSIGRTVKCLAPIPGSSRKISNCIPIASGTSRQRRGMLHQADELQDLRILELFQRAQPG
jgi:hypothetical protein